MWAQTERCVVRAALDFFSDPERNGNPAGPAVSTACPARCWQRIACSLALAAFYATRRNLFVGAITGVTVVIAASQVRGLFT